MPKDNFFIRPANDADIEHLWRLDQENNPHPWTKNHFQAALNHQQIDVLQIKQQIVAFSVWQVVLDEVELHLLLTSQAYRRQGLASALLAHFIEPLHLSCRIILEVRPSNVAAIALYERFGFQRIAVRKNYYILPNEDALIMERKC